jgi:membrane protein required for colicin V production
MIYLTAADWLIIFVLFVSTLISIFRGFVREAFSLGTWLAAILISRLFANHLSSLLVDLIELPSLRLGVSYIVLIVATLIVGAMTNNLTRELVHKIGLGGTDKFLGMFFGFARGAVVILILIAGLFYLAPVQKDDWWEDSVIIPHVVEAVEWLGPLLWKQSEKLVFFDILDGING